MYFSENVIVNFTTVTHKVCFCESSFYEPKKGGQFSPKQYKKFIQHQYQYLLNKV